MLLPMKRIVLISFLLMMPLFSKAQDLNTILLDYEKAYRTDPDKARKVITTGIAEAEKHHDNNIKAILFVKLIEYNTYIRDFKGAYKRFEAARDFAVSKKEYLQLGCAYNQIAETFHHSENYDAALRHFEKADSVYASIDDKIGVVIAKNNIANIYQEKGKYDLAVKNYLIAINDIDTTQYRYIKVEMFNSVSSLYAKLADYNKAAFYTRKAIKTALLDKKWHPENLVDTYIALADILQQQKAFADSGKILDKAEAITKSPGVQAKRFFVLQSRASLLMLQNKNEEAIRVINEALILGKRYKMNNTETFTLRSNLSKLYAGKNEEDKSLLISQELLGEATTSKRLYAMMQSYFDLSEAYSKKGDYKKAFDNHVLYVAYKDSVLGSEKQNFIKDAEVRYETAKKEKLLAENKVVLLQSRSESERKSSLVLIMGIFSVFVFLTSLLIYRQQRLKNRQKDQEYELKSAITQIETQNKLQEQRLSISRDLHDNIGAQLTFIISSVDAVKYTFDLQNPSLGTKLEQISNFTKSTIVELRDTIWAMNSAGISFENLRARIFNFIEKAKSSVNVDFRFNIGDGLDELALTSVEGMNIYRCIQESVHNSIKHSGADIIDIEVRKVTDGIAITVADNGKGFDSSKQSDGSGLRNMRKRMLDINGSFEVESDTMGTVISLFLPSWKAAENY